MTSEGQRTVAEVRTTTIENGKTDVKVKTFRGTKAEVKAELDKM